MDFYDYIVVGGGIAGVTCAEQIHNYDESSTILLISASDFVKTVTNVHYITKTLDFFDVEESDPDELQKRCPAVKVIKSPVNNLDSRNQVIKTSKKEFKYSKLCICSGAIPKVIFPENPNVLWIRDTESVTNFQKKITDAKRIVVIGNGGIATELVYEVTGVEVVWAIKDKSINSVFIDCGAATFLHENLDSDKIDDAPVLKRRKYTVDLCKKEDHMIGGALGPDWHSGLVLQGDKKHRVTIEYEVEVRNIYTSEEWNKMKKDETSGHFEVEGSWANYVELTNNKVFGCDFIISATGVIPNTEVFLKGNDFRIGEDKGLLVNDKMETSVANVYAAGDVCSAGWGIAPHWFQLRLWTQARQMGSYAAKCMWASRKGESIYMDFCFEMFAHITKFFGQKVILLGLYNGQKLQNQYEILLRVTKGKEYIKCVLVDGKMQGALLIGETDLEETFENLILNQMDLSPYGEDLLNPNVDIEDYFD